MSVLASPARAMDGRWTGEKPLDARGGVEPCFTYKVVPQVVSVQLVYKYSFTRVD